MREKWMKEALKEAKKAYKKNEVPIGCVAVKDEKIVARAHNLRETNEDPLAHAEILCLKKASKKLGGWHLNDLTLYITLEPCLMCAGAIIHARIRNVVFGAASYDSGASRFLRKNKVIVVKGILKKECSEIVSEFFKNLRKK